MKNGEGGKNRNDEIGIWDKLIPLGKDVAGWEWDVQ